MPELLGIGLGLWVVAAGLLGLLVGSFLNVVVYRLPIMLERQWQADAHAALHSEAELPPAEPFNLVVPRSRCPACGHRIAWWENLPVLSWLLLRGKCSACGSPISWRYPVVEAVTALLTAAVVWRWGLGWDTALWIVLLWALIVLALIDADTTLLPDDITLPLLWLGLLGHAALHPDRLVSAVWGAAIGYVSLWTIYWAFKLLTGKEGMGYGDFKLFAALGAWFGAAALLPLILIASMVGAVVGITLQLARRHTRGRPIPFGPFLALAGLIALYLGPQALVGWVLPGR